jgi:type IV pilus assembly protein PilA
MTDHLFMEKEKMKFFRKNQKGFTLIEALIVVIIVAILAVLGIARFLGVREATAQATCWSHLSALNASYKKWTLDHPNTVFGTTSPVEMTTVGTGLVAFVDAGSPKCPSGGVYKYIQVTDALGHVEYIADCTAGTSFGGHDNIGGGT